MTLAKFGGPGYVWASSVPVISTGRPYLKHGAAMAQVKASNKATATIDSDNFTYAALTLEFSGARSASAGMSS
ncbi:MAG: hypothetical protein ACRD72_22175 [Candidatus Angelobacter sp.]